MTDQEILAAYEHGNATNHLTGLRAVAAAAVAESKRPPPGTPTPPTLTQRVEAMVTGKPKPTQKRV